jgi:predicted MFS family arabinose efflux permease
LSNAATGAATSLVELIGARIVAGGSAGVFMATAAALAGRSTEREQRGRALATVVGGASLATALGVPLGTFLGGTFGWRAVFFGTSALSALVALILIITRATPTEDARGAGAQTPSSRSAIPILAATLIWATGSFTFFTYVSVVLHRITSVGAVGLAALLLVFGTAGAVGALLGGWLTDVKGPLTTLRLALPAVTASLIALGLLALSGERRAVGLGAATMALYGVGTWAITPPQQHRLIASGGDDRFLLSLNASVLYIGVAVGSAVGGYTLEIFGVSALCLLAAGLELGALVLVMLSGNGL